MKQTTRIPVAKPLSARALRIQGRSALAAITGVSACRKCGRVAVMPGGKVGVRRTAGGIVGFAGLATCGRVWLCPVCNAKIMAKRGLEIGVALCFAERENLLVLWGALTSRHADGDRLQTQIDVQTAAWRYLVGTRDWRESSATMTVAHNCDDGCPKDCDRQRDVVDRGTAGRVGYIRAAELSIGANGWHPHFHPMIFWRGGVAGATLEASTIVDHWRAGVLAAGGEALKHGSQKLEVLPVDTALQRLAEYVTKAVYDGLTTAEQNERKVARAELKQNRVRASQEVVWSQGKTGRGKKIGETVTHWSILGDIWRGAVTGGEMTPAFERACARWWELEEATNGHRMIAWSRGLREFAGVAAELTNEQIAAEEAGTADDTVCLITGDGWRAVRDQPAIVAGILDTLETHGWAGLRDFLTLHGIEWEPVETGSGQAPEPDLDPAESARVRDNVNRARRVWSARPRKRTKPTVKKS